MRETRSNKRRIAARRLGVLATTTALALGGLAVTAGDAGAGKPLVIATGSVQCTGLNGKLKLNPPLTQINTVPSNLTGTLKATCTGTTESGVTPKAGKATITSTGSVPGTCTRLLVPGSNPFTVKISWKASGGKIAATTIVFPNQLPDLGGYGLHDGDVTGSYAGGDTADAHVDMDVGALLSAITDDCNPKPPKNKPPKGIKKLVIISGTLAIT